MFRSLGEKGQYQVLNGKENSTFLSRMLSFPIVKLISLKKKFEVSKIWSRKIN